MVALSPICFFASAAEYSGIALAAADSTIARAIQIEVVWKIFVILGAMLRKKCRSVETQIRKKLQKYIMSM